MLYQPLRTIEMVQIPNTNFTIEISISDTDPHFNRFRRVFLRLNRDHCLEGMVHVYPPNFIERLFGITWKRKIESAKNKLIKNALSILDDEEHLKGALQEGH